MSTRRTTHALARMVTLAVASLTLIACANAGPRTEGRQSTDLQPANTGPKTLRIGFREEPNTFYAGTGGNAREHWDLFHAGLTAYDTTGNLMPKLAQKVPAVADGDWRVAPDGGMELTWKLKPGLTWHDGAPLTSDDIAFTVRLFKDPASTFPVPRGMTFVSEVVTPDPETAVLRYPRTFNAANVAGAVDFGVVPRHVLEDQYTLLGAAAVDNLPFWTSGWVGLGPFRMTNRTVGTQIEGEAFDGYVLGRPKIDRLVVKYVFDNNTLMAVLMAGDIDAVGVGNFDAPQAATLRDQWQSAGRGEVHALPTRLKQIQLQYRDHTLPWASDARVRQAMVHLIDRQALVDSIMYGFTSVADTAAPRSGPVYAILERRGVPSLSFDRGQAERLLDAAGWPRGGDGMRRNNAGAPFSYNPADVGATDDTDEVQIIVDAMRSGGISSEPNMIDDRLASAARNEAVAHAHSISRPAAADGSYWNRYISSQIGTAANRWAGNNSGGYVNPEVDRLYDQWVVALDPAARMEREADLHKLLADEVVHLPLYFEVDVLSWRTGISGPKLFSGWLGNLLIDVHTWTMS